MSKPGNTFSYSRVCIITVCIITTTLSLVIVDASGLTPTVVAAPQTTASWTATGNLNTARSGHTAILLRNGKVLVAGGNGPTCELYDPVTRTWSQTGSLNAARGGHTATLLPNGQVLVAGGFASQIPLNSAELYDPTTGVWRLTGSFNAIRWSGPTTLLLNGQVLAVGSSGTEEAVAELYDPMTGTWHVTGTPQFSLSPGHTVLLPSGKVLGVDEGTPWDYGDLPTEIYDPTTGQWSSSGYLGLFWAPTVTLLQNGKVLATGLLGANNPTQAALYDVSKGTWSMTGSLSTYRHYGGYTATLLLDGQVLVAGGSEYPSFEPTPFEELYDPNTGTWTRTSPLITDRQYHTATLLQDGKVLVAGGVKPAPLANSILGSAEVYDRNANSSSNPIDDAQFFVQQHYRDFLNRESDVAGLAFWTNEITSCSTDTQCIEIKRINVSAAFFLSIEFQESGYLVYRMYKVAFGDRPGTSVPLTFQEFLPDSQRVGQGVVVGSPGWEQTLENNKNAFASEFVARSRFTTVFPPGMTSEQFADALNANAGGVLSQGERSQLVSELASGAKTRAQVLRSVAENVDLAHAEFNKAFVLMQYFGYLRRNPNDAPDADFGGYNFWLNKLNQFNGNFIEAQMVKAFISSAEYRQRVSSCSGCWDYLISH